MPAPPPPPESPDASSPVTDTVISLDAAGDPVIAALLETAYRRTVDVEVAARHLWAIDREAARLAAVPAQRVPSAGRRAVVAALTSALLVTSSSAAVAASSSTVPGDLLYGLKRTVERARLLTATSPEADAAVLLDIARNRLVEAEAAATPELAADLVDEALVALSGVDAARVPAARAAVEGLREDAVTQVRAVAGAVGPARTERLIDSASETATGGPAVVLPDIPDRAPPPPPEPPPAPELPPVPETGTAGAESPQPEPSAAPSPEPSPAPGPPVGVPEPSPEPTSGPSPAPGAGTGFSGAPTEQPSAEPSAQPTQEPSAEPSPSASPSASPDGPNAKESEGPPLALPSDDATEPGEPGVSGVA